jgi:metallophosphoesterase (TIGR00282 family)
MVGDVVGRPGRRILREQLGSIRDAHDVDFVVANGENAAGGAGITARTFQEILDAGVDVVTTGNHVYRHRDILPVLESEEERLVRPANFAPDCPGRGVTVRPDRRGRPIGVVNLQGRVYMPPTEDPFEAAERAVRDLDGEAAVILVDVHAEATSEKEALGWFLDGRVSVLAGTHTHVPTADERVLPGGTAYVTDLGMTGPHDSCLGVKTDIIIRRFRTGMPARFEVAADDVRLQGVLVELDDMTGRAVRVERVERRLS